MIRKPSSVKAIPLDGTNESEATRISAGSTRISISPRSSTTVTVAFIKGGTQNTGSNFQLVNGQPFSFDANAGDEFAEFDLFFFASSTVTVDLVW